MFLRGIPALEGDALFRRPWLDVGRPSPALAASFCGRRLFRELFRIYRAKISRAYL